MEKIKTAPKIKKKPVNKAEDASESDVVIFDEKFGVTMTVDNSLKRFANDPFVIEHNKRVERKLAGFDSDHLFPIKKPV